MRQVVGKVGHGRFVEAGADMLYLLHMLHVPVAFVVSILVLVVLVLTAQKLVVLDHHFTALVLPSNTAMNSVKTTRTSKMTAQDRREKEDPNHRKGREGRKDDGRHCSCTSTPRQAREQPK